MITRTRRSYRRLLAATLLLSGTLPLAAPVLADGTAAGAQISNTATATYQDPNNPGTTLNATSNTVVVTVAEVAGITVTPLATTDVNGGTVLPSDLINYDYAITNVGNDPTQFFIPGAATISGPGTAGTLQISIDGGTTYTNIPAAGITTASVPPGGSVRVRVPVTVSALASSGSTISVLLGNTGANDNSAATQNQPKGTAPAGNDLYSVDNADSASGEAAGTPSNGEREASSVQQILVGAQPQAFAAILNTRTGYSDNSTPATLSDDTITYGLALRVDATAPTGSSGLVPAGLVGTTVNGIGTNRVLVSDAIPTGTVLTGTPIAPTGWTAVYTTDPLTTTANDATWTTTQPAPNTIKRVGFVYDASTTTIAAGTTINGFSFTVTTNGITTTTTVANVAQLFGQTQGGGTTLVYDESGDQNPSNVNDNGTPGSNTPTNGVANPATDGVDNNNNNTGSGSAGENNVFTIAAPGTILNGPNGQAAAVGPTNNNDDFTNKSTPIPTNTAPGTKIDPDPATFSNTISNPSSTGTLTNVLVVPDVYNFTPGNGEVLPPKDTTVTLTYGSQTAVYTFDGTNFVFTSGTAITIPSLTPGTSVNYNVSVDLPANTDLSTDTGKGFSIPIYAFQDSNGNSRPDATDITQNRNIDRVYTGFLKLVKDARILDANGTTVIEDYTQTPTPANILPGRFIEYRITYTNISIAPVGAGNATLNAGNVLITEDGTIAPNNWAKDNDGNGAIDTSNVVGSATASFGTITYTPTGDQSGTTPATDVTKYVNAPGISIQPGANGTFTFRRKIN